MLHNKLCLLYEPPSVFNYDNISWVIEMQDDNLLSNNIFKDTKFVFNYVIVVHRRMTAWTTYVFINNCLIRTDTFYTLQLTFLSWRSLFSWIIKRAKRVLGTPKFRSFRLDTCYEIN